jgi:hypothetical protein
MFQERFPTEGRSRQAAQRFILLGDPALSPDLGRPTLTVEVNGVPVEDPTDPFFAAPDDFAGPLQIEVTAADGRGIVATRVIDSARGAVPPAEYQTVTDVATPDGVPQVVTLTHALALRPGETYEVRYEAEDPSGRTSAFVVLTDTRFYFLDRPAAFPNPFRDRTAVAFKATRAIHSARLDVFTITGRRIREIRHGALPANVQHAFEWDGRDDHGLDVANGTYLGRISLESAGGPLSATMPVVRIR